MKASEWHIQQATNSLEQSKTDSFIVFHKNDVLYRLSSGRYALYMDKRGQWRESASVTNESLINSSDQ